MAPLWINLIIVYTSSFFARYFSKSRGIIPPFVKPNKLLILISMLSLVIISGLRNDIGDTFFYMYSYKNIDFKTQKIKLNGDFGFNLFQGLLQRISNDPQILIFTVALITNLLIIMVLFKYSRMIELSLFIYITSGLYTVSMNGIRQFLAASIVFLATKFILDGNFIKYLLLVLLACTMHQTAYIFIPIYFVVRREAWTKTTFILLGIGVVIAAGFNQFSNILFSALQDTHYGQYSNIEERGANILRVAVTSVPLIIAYFGREKLRELWPKSDYIVNLSTLGLVFMIISTKNWIFARFDIYFGLYNCILISWIILLFSKSDRKIAYFLLFGCYLYYFYYEQVISLNIIYTSKYINI